MKIMTNQYRSSTRRMQRNAWRVYEPGCTAYADALALQHRLVQTRKSSTMESDLLILLEHPPVFTLGRRGGRENLRVSNDFLEKSDIPIIQAERGGNITYHGPGQLVAYIIVDLEASRISVKDLVEQLEETMIRTAHWWGIKASRNPTNRGIWVGNRKMGSIGIAIRKGVTYHGLALNVDMSLEPFRWINPCGLQNVDVTSLQQESPRHSITMQSVQPIFKRQFETVFNIDLEPVGPDEMGIETVTPAGGRSLRNDSGRCHSGI
jgi:lipoate-protein ligase B